MSGHTPLPPTLIELPMLPLRDVVVFPHMVIPLFVGRPKSIKALESAMAAERRIMLVAQKAAAKDEPSVADMFDVGCVSTILQMLKLPDGTVKVLVEGQQRAKVGGKGVCPDMVCPSCQFSYTWLLLAQFQPSKCKG